MKQSDCREGMLVKIVRCDDPSAHGIRGVLVRGNDEFPFLADDMALKVIDADLKKAQSCNSWYPPQRDPGCKDYWAIHAEEVAPCVLNGFKAWAKEHP